MKILVLCTGNSCRSQMAHGWVSYLSSSAKVFSAGTKPAKKVNPFAIEAMKKFNIDISSNSINSVKDYEEMDFNLVLTVCDQAKETCPVVFNTLESEHKSFPDPFEYKGTDEEKLDYYLEVCVGIKNWITEVLSERGLVENY